MIDVIEAVAEIVVCLLVILFGLILFVAFCPRTFGRIYRRWRRW